MILKNNVCKKDIFYLMNKYFGVVSTVETEMLLEYLFNCEKLDLYVRDFAVNETMEELYDSLIERRIGGEPVQHITGRAEFNGFDFIVTKDTFIPRPETEILVNEICRGGFKTLPYILDLCTGCGNIAISLAKLIPQAEITATDISEAALRIAEKNAERHNVSGRIKFYKGNIFNALIFDTFARHKNNGGLSINIGMAEQEDVVINPKFDIILCNPPYIRKAEFPYLQKEVKREPEVALNGGEDGLDFYRVIASRSHRYLKKHGSILLEIGFGQARAVKDIFSSRNIFEIHKTIEDFSGIERAIWINLL